MNYFKYSIIIPVYNRERVIKRCIKSVLRQDYKNFEIIIIDDGSVDETKDIIENYLSEDNRITFINIENNKGVNFARNRGIEKADGDYIIFLDSDDWFTDTALNDVNDNINQYHGYSHYLYTVSDRIKDINLPENYTEIYYKDWLTGKITGDFTHVIKPECFKDKLFWEQFNGYERLNWLRVMKESQPMFFTNNAIENIERGRKDSLSVKLSYGNANRIQEKYEAGALYFKLYKNDLTKFNCIPTKELSKTVIFGKIANQSNDQLYNLLKMQNWMSWFLIKTLPALFWEKIITLNAMRKRGNVI